MKLFTFPAALPSLFFEPLLYRPNGIGYWSGHIPFACDLVATMRPRVFVELGTHTGESYFAFCQALAEQRIVCEAFAIDTWQGDQHTGAYDESVFGDVNSHNQSRYSGFSRLLRMSFDQASSEFADESIDLLHIDGAHTYEAVRHDFDTWWPKVRPGGVVLLHDSAERQADFGVWQLVEDLQTKKLPVCEFKHSHGLAVVMKPPLLIAHVASLFVRAKEPELVQIRRYYEVCAGHLQTRYWERRQLHPAEWEITTQVFWRASGQGFTETESIRLAHIVCETPSSVWLNVPSSAAETIIGLRLHPTLAPAIVWIFEIAVLSGAGEILWKWDRPEGQLFAGAAEVSFTIPMQTTTSVSVRLTIAGADPVSAAKVLTQSTALQLTAEPSR